MFYNVVGHSPFADEKENIMHGQTRDHIHSEHNILFNCQDLFWRDTEKKTSTIVEL